MNQTREHQREQRKAGRDDHEDGDWDVGRNHLRKEESSARRPEKRLVYNTRPQGWSRKRAALDFFLQLSDFKPLLWFHCLTLAKCEPYTERMGKMHLFACAVCL